MRRVRASALIVASLVGCTGREAPADTAHEGSTGTAASSDGTGSTTVASSSTGADEESESSSSSSGESGCSPTVDAPEFAQISPLSLGLTHVYDIDRDGALDVVGGRGVLLLANLDVVEVADAPATNNGRPGLFDDGAEPDLVFATGTDGRIVLFPSVALGGGAPIVTTGVEAGTFDAHDVDGDGLDDVATGTSLSGDVEIWIASANGEFTLGSRISTSAFPLPAFFADAEHGLRLAVTNSISGAAVFSHDEGAEFVASGDIGALGLFAAESFDRSDTGNEWLLGGWWFDNGFEVSSGVGVFFEDEREWVALWHTLDGDSFQDLGQGDLDDDGVRDVIVPRSTADGPVLELLCLRPDALAPCGAPPIEHVPESIVVLPDPPRIVYSTVDDGTWQSPIEVGECG